MGRFFVKGGNQKISKPNHFHTKIHIQPVTNNLKQYQQRSGEVKTENRTHIGAEKLRGGGEHTAQAAANHESNTGEIK